MPTLVSEVIILMRKTDSCLVISMLFRVFNETYFCQIWNWEIDSSDFLIALCTTRTRAKVGQPMVVVLVIAAAMMVLMCVIF